MIKKNPNKYTILKIATNPVIWEYYNPHFIGSQRTDKRPS
jgi:hypothetical protein